MMWDDGRWEMHDGGGMWWLMGLGVLLLAVIAATLVLALVRGIGPSSAPGPGTPPNDAAAWTSEARRILERRLASGEIDEEEFRRRLGALEHSTG